MLGLIIGTGSIGQRHIRNIRKLVPESRFIFLRKGGRQDELSASINAEVTDNLDHALGSKPDYAVIATPSALHTDVLIPLIDAHLPFYIEKPVATRREDVNAIRFRLKSSSFKSPTLVGCNLRFLPALQKARALLNDGSLGTVLRAGFTAGQWLPDWRPQQDYKNGYSSNREMGGGVVFDLIHEIDMVRWWFGEFERIGSVLGNFSSLGIETEDTAAIVMGKNEGPPAVTIQLDYISRKPVRRYEVVGELGSLVFDLQEKTLMQITKDGSEAVNCGADGFDVSKTYELAMREFFEAIKAGAATSQNILDGLDSVELALNVYERTIQ
ncbi:MAG: Gfo/Idh/MocA family oxidoreductase [Candidatus Nitronauta litoralis]|uniref:Gfo/Idh/MocA family oxidoreductase n=1 Tax=Candidatus Nitronauta litoralis TaxID=2705533 RepID=A0A7T0G0X9_9BACT|nr:MAG: Gfo/Idh/MocA family oxidoreductase [Candidatus Nitronauta litoralis]